MDVLTLTHKTCIQTTKTHEDSPTWFGNEEILKDAKEEQWKSHRMYNLGWKRKSEGHMYIGIIGRNSGSSFSIQTSVAKSK